MAQIKQEEIDKERELQTVIWNLRKRFFHGEDKDPFWDELYAEVERISKENNSLYVDQMLCVLIDDIETRMRQAAGETVDSVERLTHTMQIHRNLLDRYRK